MRKSAKKILVCENTGAIKKRPSEEGLKHSMLVCFLVCLLNYYRTFNWRSQEQTI